MSKATGRYPDTLPIQPLDRPPTATIAVPGSKSITNRALVLAALSARGYACALRGVLRSEDTEVMIDALRGLGFRVLTEWPESAVFVSAGADDPLIPARTADLYVANSGTTMRFLTALVSLGDGCYRLHGTPRMHARPIGDLLDALRPLGVRAESENNNGCPPVVVTANGLKGGHVHIKGDVSSQFLSGLLLAAPFADDQVHIEVEGPLVSWPYVRMTLQMLESWGLLVLESEQTRFVIPGRQRRRPEDQHDRGAAIIQEGLDPRKHVWMREYFIEPDASAAGYFFAAAAITGGTVTVSQLTSQSLQGDVRFTEVLEEMGCRALHGDVGLTVRGGPLHGIDADMNDISDTVMTLAAVACFASGPTTIRHVAHIRHKESDRLAALATELRRLGAEIEEFADGLKITPRPLHGAIVETYNDHRLAMSLALIGLVVPGVVIRNPGCVAKTYPDFFADLEKLRC
jgi:3-phosphoshikimate 1-carboxyvinyltransferase